VRDEPAGDLVGGEQLAGRLEPAVGQLAELAALDRGGDRLDPIAQPLAQPGVVEHQLGADRARDVGELVDPLDVELGLEQRAVGGERGTEPGDPGAAQRLAMLDPGLLADPARDPHDVAQPPHLGDQRVVAGVVARRRPVLEVNRAGAAERRVDLLGEERQERRGDAGELGERAVQRLVARALGGVEPGPPQRRLEQPQVPGRQRGDEVLERAVRAREVVAGHRRLDLDAQQLGLARERALEPPGLAAAAGREAVAQRVRGVEVQDVPQRQVQPAHRVLDAGAEEPDVAARHRTGHQERRAQRVRAVLGDQRHRIGVVA
jgi:hypothetical protein